MWVVLASWIVGDDGLELGEGDPWTTVLEVSLDGAKAVESGPLRCQLGDDPFSAAGPHYDIVAEVRSDEVCGSFLDAGGINLTPSAEVGWPQGTLLAFKSELRGGWYPLIPPPAHLMFAGEIRRMFVRQQSAALDGSPSSFRPYREAVRFLAIQQIQTWETMTALHAPGNWVSDYLLELIERDGRSAPRRLYPGATERTSGAAAIGSFRVPCGANEDLEQR